MRPGSAICRGSAVIAVGKNVTTIHLAVAASALAVSASTVRLVLRASGKTDCHAVCFETSSSRSSRSLYSNAIRAVGTAASDAWTGPTACLEKIATSQIPRFAPVPRVARGPSTNPVQYVRGTEKIHLTHHTYTRSSNLDRKRQGPTETTSYMYYISSKLRSLFKETRRDA